MKTFFYKARNEQGKLVEGSTEGDSEDNVTTKMIRNGLIPIFIEEDRGLSLEERFNHFFTLDTPKIDDLIVFSHQMYTMLNAGVPIIKSLKIVNDSLKNDLLNPAISGVIQDLESGHSLSSALSHQTRVFPKIFTSMAHIGESTGNLDNSFDQICRYLEAERSMTRRVNAATRYPMFVSIALLVAIIIINVFVIPTFEDFFRGMKVELPLMTQILFTSSNFVQANLSQIFLSVVLSWGLFQYWKYTPNGDFKWSKIRLNLPFMGHIIHKALVARVCRSFSLMLGSGVPVLQALVIVSKSIENTFMVEKIILMRIGLEQGDSLPEVANRAEIFTPLVLQMLVIGEETGDMTSILNKIAEQYEEDVDYELKRLSEVIEPILIAVVSAIVIVLALGIFMPMWQMPALAMSG